MNRKCFAVSILALCSGVLCSESIKAADSSGQRELRTGSGLIWGFNPATPVVGQPVASGVGGGFGSGLGGGFFNSGGFGQGFPAPIGFIGVVDTNFVAMFPDEFGTNFVVLPFAATNLTPFAGRVPLGPLAPAAAPTPGNAAPGPAPAVPAQDPFVKFPQPSITPVVPPSGQLPPVGQPFPPTGRPLSPPKAPAAAPK